MNDDNSETSNSSVSSKSFFSYQDKQLEAYLEKSRFSILIEDLKLLFEYSFTVSFNFEFIHQIMVYFRLLQL
jgi:hypothetical protein